MLKARSGNNLILGIDSENVKRLKDNKPIKVKGSDLGIDQDIFIVYGDTLADIQKELNIPSAH